MINKQRQLILARLGNKILANTQQPLVVGISGIDGSGKTRLTQELAEWLEQNTSQQIIMASIDGFHNPREKRYAQGRNSPQGYFEDSFNLSAVIHNLVEPFRQSKPFNTQVFNVKTNLPVEQPVTLARKDSILLLEGIFLFQPTILPYLGLTIWVDIPFDVALQRMLKRDAESTQAEENVKSLFEMRYKPGQELYLNKNQPRKIADIIIDNSNLEDPRIVTL